MGLTLNEGSISKRVKLAVLHHLDEGFIVGERWFDNAEEAVQELNGSSSEKEFTLKLMLEASGSGIRISKVARPLKEVETLSKLPQPRVMTYYRDCGKIMGWPG